jgi:hypothetical protein
MKDGHFQILLLEEINKIIGLPVDNDFSNYIEKYDNGVFRTDRNFEYTAYINNSIKTFIVSFNSELWHKYISQKTKISCVRLKLYQIDLEYIGKLKLDYVKLHFNNSEIAFFKIVTTNVYMNFLSPWLKKLGDAIYPGKNTLDLQFPVDINRFCPSEKTGEPVIYFKRRDRSILNRFLEYSNSVSYKIFDYSSGYNEDDFREAIAKAPYCVWIGCHESQGFALQETLSSNTPIFVIDAKSLRDEVGVWDNWMSEIDLLSTSASYFDATCGIVSDVSEFEERFRDFLNAVDSFKPRDFVIRTLSPEACIKKWINKLP